MTTVTWDEGRAPPIYARGLPHEVHFWKSGGDIYLMRTTDELDMPAWCRWNIGTPIKDVCLDHNTTQGFTK